ncbi:MAG: BamA/TamA family outer membrane protein [Pseudomonadota bacterium]
MALTLIFAVASYAQDTVIRFDARPADDDLQRALVDGSLLAAAQRNGTTSAQELTAAARAEYGRLLGILYEDGRYGAVISVRIDGREASTLAPLDVPEAIELIEVRVRPGPTYRFDRLAAGPRARGTILLPEFAPGERGGTGVIADAAAIMIDEWRLAGHAKARIAEQQITARHDTRRIDVMLVVDQGPKLNFGPISLSGNDNVRSRRIRTIAGLEEGAPFDPLEVARAERRLRRAGSFRSVVVKEATEIGPNSSLPLEIAVVEQTPRRFGFGAEYSTVEGVGLSAFWLHRNLLGGAERFRVDAELAGIGGETGGIDYQIGVRYERPATPRADVDLFAELTFAREDEIDFVSDTSEFTLGFTRYAADDLVVEFGLGFLYSEVTDNSGSDIFKLFTLPLAATRDRRSDPLNPTKGVFFNLEATPFLGISDSPSGTQVTGDARGYRTFGTAFPTTAALRLQFGSLVGPSLDAAPPFYLFYSGGGGTVRGQDYQSLAVDNNGERLGGRSFFGASAEARVSVTDTIQLVGFYDYGYVSPESDWSDGESHAGAGLGLRYVTGIGPIRLDLATPVSGDTDASNVYIYIGIGQAF